MSKLTKISGGVERKASTEPNISQVQTTEQLPMHNCSVCSQPIESTDSVNACNCPQIEHFIHRKCMTQEVVSAGITLCPSIGEQDIILEYNRMRSPITYFSQSIFWNSLNGILLILGLIWSLRQFQVILIGEGFKSEDTAIQKAQTVVPPLISVVSALFAFRRIYKEYIVWRNTCLSIHFKYKQNSE